LLEYCEDWREAVPLSARALGHNLASDGAVFITQTFPVVETRGRAMEDLRISEPVQVVDMGFCENEPAWQRFYCYNPGTPGEEAVHGEVGRQLYDAAGGSAADVIIGIVPPGFASHWAGLHSWVADDGLTYIAQTLGLGSPGDEGANRRKRFILAELDELNSAGLAHEFGHFFDFSHCPGNPRAPGPDGEDCRPPRIVGFRLNPSGVRGFNKHDEEGNQEASDLVPVMHYAQHPVASTFIGATTFGELFDRISNVRRRQGAAALPMGRRRPWPSLASIFFPRPVYAQSARPAVEGGLIVRGSVQDGRVALHRVQDQAGVDPTPATSGRMTLELLDAAGRVLSTMSFNPAAADRWHGGPAARATFSLDVAAPVGLHAIRVTGPGGATAERSRSASPPSIRADVRSAGQPPVRTLHWTTDDPDGDDVRVDVYLRADGDVTWRGIAIDSSLRDLRLDDFTLPTGERVTARLVASDGFNTASTEVELGTGAPLTVLATHPSDGAGNVATSTDILVVLSAPLRMNGNAGAGGLDAEQLHVTGPDGQQVFADLQYRNGTGTLILTPVQPLRPGTRYTVSLASGLEDIRGGRLSEALTWSFVTESVPSSSGGFGAK
jgi:hypothetical protein